MNPHYPFVAKRAAHRCEYCRAPEAIFNFPFEVEHIIPLSRGGCDDVSNLALACRACNLRKYNHLKGFDQVTQKLTRLFHPRRDIWSEHFQVIEETGQIKGITPVGRATVERLQMNSHVQQAARSLWLKLSIFD